MPLDWMIVAVVVLLIALALCSWLKAKKAGVGPCGCRCDGCPCHAMEQKERQKLCKKQS